MQTQADQLDNIFAALAHRKRRAMVERLAMQPATIKQLADANQLSLPAMDKHVQVLERGQLIIRRKVGRTNFIALNARSLHLLREYTAQFHTGWGNSQERLDNYIASLQE